MIAGKEIPKHQEISPCVWRQRQNPDFKMTFPCPSNISCIQKQRISQLWSRESYAFTHSPGKQNNASPGNGSGKRVCFYPLCISTSFWMHHNSTVIVYKKKEKWNEENPQNLSSSPWTSITNRNQITKQHRTLTLAAAREKESFFSLPLARQPYSLSALESHPRILPPLSPTAHPRRTSTIMIWIIW